MSDDLFSVADQVVLVSGGSRGIGKALAKGFVERGAKVVISSRDKETLEKTAAEISTADNKVLPLVCDVADPKAITPLVSQVISEFGRIDTLLNVAGVNRRIPAENIAEDDFDFIMNINLKGAFLMAQAVGREMLGRGSGNLINIVSLNNDRPLAWVMPYAASKAALGHLTRSMALEWGDRGVRVNAIAPGFILTDLSKKLWSDENMQAWGRFNTPQRRLGVPDDLVGTAIFLASKASTFMTGQILYVDGGFNAGTHWPIESAK
jgi:gluconate 5-dehydrogenase